MYALYALIYGMLVSIGYQPTYTMPYFSLFFIALIS